MRWDATIDYIAAVIAGLLYGFLIGCASLLFDLANGAGFNPFEIMFFRGFVAFICGIIYDASDKYMMQNNKQQKNININENVNIFDISSANMTETMSDDMFISSSAGFSQENRPLILDPNMHTGDNHDQTSGGVTSRGDNDGRDQRLVVCTGPSLDIVYTANLYNCKSSNYDDKYKSRLWLTIRGFFRVPTVIFLYFSLALIYLGTSITLQSTSAIWSLFIDKWMFKKKLTWDHYAATLIVLIGTILVTQPWFIFNKSNDNDNSRTNSSLLTTLGFISGIGSAICQAAAFAAMHKFTSIEKTRNVGDMSIIFAGMYSVNFHYTIFGIIASYIVYGEFLYNNIYHVGIYGMIYVIGIGLFNLSALISVNFSVARLTVNEFSLLALTEVIWAYVFQCTIFNETGDWITILGVFLIIVPMCGLFGYHIYVEKMRLREEQNR